MVSAVPVDSLGADCATKEENWGESAITVIPQIINKVKKRPGESCRKNGESKQAKRLIISEIAATILLPLRNEMYPPSTHPKLPTPITRNDRKETDNPLG